MPATKQQILFFNKELINVDFPDFPSTNFNFLLPWQFFLYLTIPLFTLFLWAILILQTVNEIFF